MLMYLPIGFPKNFEQESDLWKPESWLIRIDPLYHPFENKYIISICATEAYKPYLLHLKLWKLLHTINFKSCFQPVLSSPFSVSPSCVLWKRNASQTIQEKQEIGEKKKQKFPAEVLVCQQFVRPCMRCLGLWGKVEYQASFSFLFFSFLSFLSWVSKATWQPDVDCCCL